MRLLVTGNIGCGKSTALAFFRELLPHYRVFDYDLMIAELYTIPSIQRQLFAAFGTVVKAEISDIVHGNSVALKTLSEILNENIQTNVVRVFKYDDIILDIPLYFEHFEQMIEDQYKPDQILCICADEVTQIERVKQRNGWSEEKIKSVIAKQLPQREKTERSHYLIMNTGTLEDLKSAVENYTNSRAF